MEGSVPQPFARAFSHDSLCSSKLARRAKVTSQFLLIPAFCGLFVCQPFSAVIFRQIWLRKKRILEHYIIICTRNTTFPFNQQYRNDGKSNLPPERRKNDPHAQEKRKKNNFVSTFYQLIAINSKLTQHIQNLNVVIINTFFFFIIRLKWFQPSLILTFL